LSDTVHRPVMVASVLFFLDAKEGDVAFDATLGAAGHSCEIAKCVGPTGLVLGIDRDAAALEIARTKLNGLGRPFRLYQGDYTQIGEVLEREGIEGVDCLLFDLGLSSDQLASADRGFSFATEGPLDMRFDAGSDLPTGADLIARLSEKELADIFYHFGEERASRRIAARIVERRRREPIRTTTQLANIVLSCMKGKRGRIHPATRVFQGLRIAVNRELELLDKALDCFPQWLKPGGRVVFISFHSLEDRRIKFALKRHASGGVVEILTKKVVRGTAEEISENPRARSAKLRAATRRSET